MRPETPQQFVEVQKECIRQVKFYVDIAARKLGVHMPYPRIKFNLRGTTAGYATYAENLIEFNPALLRDNVEDFLNRTPGHEVAHLVTRRLHSYAKPHGPEWKHVMWAFGLPAIRCHNYQIRGALPKRQVQPVQVDDGIIVSKRGLKITRFD